MADSKSRRTRAAMNELGETVVDNSELRRREAWIADRLVAWVDADVLAKEDHIGRTSSWWVARWMPDRPFGTLLRATTKAGRMA